MRFHCVHFGVPLPFELNEDWNRTSKTYVNFFVFSSVAELRAFTISFTSMFFCETLVSITKACPRELVQRGGTKYLITNQTKYSSE